MDALDIASRFGFRISMKAGAQKTFCPKCTPYRKNKDDRSLSVRIDETGIGWRCFNCNWSGGEFKDDQRPARKMAGKAGDQFGSRDAYGALQRKARAGWSSPSSHGR